ncbi:MAG: methionyl-tRNA formyltransferase [Patescibacteria group bacterium]
MKDYKIIFMGTPEIAEKSLQKLINFQKYKPSLVITQEDKPIGRNRIVTSPPTKILAEKNNIEVWQPKNLRDRNFLLKIREFSPDIIIVLAYGKIIPKEIIDIPKFGILNIHTSLLPNHRGASPIQHSILEGDKITGVTIIKIDEILDHGPIIAKKEIGVSDDENQESLHLKLANLGADLLLETLPLWLEEKIIPEEQDHKKATFTKILKREDGEIKDGYGAEKIDRMFRAFSPWPGVYIVLKGKDGKDFKVKLTKLSISNCQEGKEKLYLNKDRELVLKTSNGSIILKEVQPESKNKMSGEAFYSGYIQKL